MTCASAVLVRYAEHLVATDQMFMWLLFYDIIKSCAGSAFYLSASAFHFVIGDPLMGGVYMTLLNSSKYAFVKGLYEQPQSIRHLTVAEGVTGFPPRVFAHISCKKNLKILVLKPDTEKNLCKFRKILFFVLFLYRKDNPQI